MGYVAVYIHGKIMTGHYSDSMSHITGVSIACSAFFQAQIKENIKAPRHWTFSGESAGDRWIPLTKGQ